MQHHEKNRLQWLEFDLFSKIPHLQHGTLLRHGGVSSGLFSSLNLGSHLGDDPDKVSENRKIVRTILQIPRFVWGRQVHGINIAEVHPDSPLSIPDCDALMTDHSDIALMIQHADCQAVVIYDPENHAIANAHVGWRGNVQSMIQKVIEKMHLRYGSKPEQLRVGISPSLGPDASQFINYKTELPEGFCAYQFKPLYFDLWAISHMQLTSCGVRPEHIEIARQCTFANPQDFYSYRYNKVRGGNGTFVMIKNKNVPMQLV